MNILNSMGLWMLLGIPVLIIIYLIKSRHEEHHVSSTYLWKLSERFMKQRVPLQRLRKILMFLLQLILVIAIAFMAVQPVLNHGKAIHYILILDSSASMQTENTEGKSRFERALEMVETFAAETGKGHKVSLIVASDSAACVISKSDSESAIKRTLQKITCSNGEADLNGAISMASELVDNTMEQQVMILTDRPGENNTNVTVVDLSEEEWNVCISSMTAHTQGKETVFTAAISDTRSETVTVGLKINGKLKDAAKVELTANVAASVSFTTDVTKYDTAEIFVETSDGLQSDNSYALCESNEVSADVLILSDSPRYLEKVFTVQENCTVTVVSSTDETELTGYDLYIFDGIVPKDLPEDGSILYLNTSELPEGVSVKESVQKEAELGIPNGAAGSFYEDLSIRDTVVSSYGSLTAGTSWNTLLVCGEDPVLMSRTLSNGLKEMVLSFDLHDTNLTLKTSFVVLARNLLQYSVPRILEESDQVIGETVNLAILPNAETLYVKTPGGIADKVSATGLYSVYAPNETGIYTAVETSANGAEYADFFVHLPSSELTESTSIQGLSVELEELDTNAESAVQKLIFWIALVVLILVLAEWGIYYYEQY